VSVFAPEVKSPEAPTVAFENVMLWAVASLFVNVTTAPLATWMFAGENAKFCNATLVVTTGVVVVGFPFDVPVVLEPPQETTSAAKARRGVLVLMIESGSRRLSHHQRNGHLVDE